MKAFLIRYVESDQGTKGFFFFGPFQCYMLELPWRNNNRNVSCIKTGEYEVVPWKSRRFGRCYHLLGTEGRSYILTHSGNFAGDKSQGWQTHSEGCLLVGSEFGMIKNKFGQKQLAVLNSRFTLEKMISNIGFRKWRLTIIGREA